MWLVLLPLLSAGAAPAPSIAQLSRTALQPRWTDLRRLQAVEALAALETEDALTALTLVAATAGPDSTVGRAATTSLIRQGDLDALLQTPWPDWARAEVDERVGSLVASRCADPTIGGSGVSVELLLQHCGGALSVSALASQLVAGSTEVARNDAAMLLRGLREGRREEVEAAVLAAVSFRDHEAPPFEGETAVLTQVGLSTEARATLTRELVTWRIAVTLVGAQHVPPRLDAELRRVLAGEIETIAEPVATRDWLHLLAASGSDPARVLERLNLSGDPRWQVVLDEDALLHGDAPEALPLLAHLSAVVRCRAARRLESDPAAAIAALDRAWRFLPGRVAPLRGDLEAPRLDRGPEGTEAWAYNLVRWARRSSRQNDDSALRAILWLLCDPSVSGALPDDFRRWLSEQLLQTARRDEGVRSALLSQGMDALLRQIPFEEAADPAPAQVTTGDTWVRPGAE